MVKPYWKVTLWYALFGAAWIFFTDQWVAAIAGDMKSLVALETVKGWIYVGLSALLIFFLVKSAWDRRAAQERDKHEVFSKTVEGAHHILLNYLNQMQLVRMEAERCKDFDPELLKLARAISDEATTALMKLDAVERLTAGNIHQAVHGTSAK